MYAGVTPTKFGRLHKIEPLGPERLHFHQEGAKLREVSHALALPVLDQEDLHKQDIDTSKIVAGAPAVDALGSCTANATTASLAERYKSAGKPLPAGLSASDAVADEVWRSSSTTRTPLRRATRGRLLTVVRPGLIAAKNWKPRS